MATAAEQTVLADQSLAEAERTVREGTRVEDEETEKDPSTPHTRTGKRYARLRRQTFANEEEARASVGAARILGDLSPIAAPQEEPSPIMPVTAQPEDADSRKQDGKAEMRGALDFGGHITEEHGLGHGLSSDKTYSAKGSAEYRSKKLGFVPVAQGKALQLSLSPAKKTTASRLAVLSDDPFVREFRSTLQLPGDIAFLDSFPADKQPDIARGMSDRRAMIRAGISPITGRRFRAAAPPSAQESAFSSEDVAERYAALSKEDRERFKDMPLEDVRAHLNQMVASYRAKKLGPSVQDSAFAGEEHGAPAGTEDQAPEQEQAPEVPRRTASSEESRRRAAAELQTVLLNRAIVFFAKKHGRHFGDWLALSFFLKQKLVKSLFERDYPSGDFPDTLEGAAGASGFHPSSKRSKHPVFSRSKDALVSAVAAAPSKRGRKRAAEISPESVSEATEPSMAHTRSKGKPKAAAAQHHAKKRKVGKKAAPKKKKSASPKKPRAPRKKAAAVTVLAKPTPHHPTVITCTTHGCTIKGPHGHATPMYKGRDARMFGAWDTAAEAVPTVVRVRMSGK